MSRMIRVLPVALAAVCLLMPGCFKAASTSPWPTNANGPKVVTSFAPIACFTLNVAGDAAAIRAVMSSQGPHDYQSTRGDALGLQEADLFIINGLDLDTSIASKMMAGSSNKKLKLIDLGSKIPEKDLLEGEHDHDHDHAHGHEHNHGIDPHIWMSPLLACRMTETIRDELKLANPAGAAEYDRRAGEYIAKLKAIHADGVARLKGKENRRLITMHESMNYFAEAFDLKIAGSIQSAPGQEPSRKKLDQVVKVCLDKKITVLAVEPQYTTSNAVQAIQRELKAKGGTELIVIELDPLETCTTPLPAADFYETKLKANIDALVKALK